MSFRDLLVCLDPHDLTAVRHVSEFAVNLSRMAVIEELLFGSGRPLILVPAEKPSKFSSDLVVVAWDGSQPAARAVHDAIPILQKAVLTEIITIDAPGPEEFPPRAR